MPLSEDPGSEPAAAGLIAFGEVAAHNTAGDLWCIVEGKVYDFTAFAPEHPGGAAVVAELAGGDATEEFLRAHPIDIMTLTLGKKGLKLAYKGDIDPATVPASAHRSRRERTLSSSSENHHAAAAASGGFVALRDLPNDQAPPLDAVLNLHDFEAIAQRVMVRTGKKEAWDYYSSGADDELTYNENVSAFQRVWLKPRILVDVATVDTSCTILGSPSGTPVYLSAVAMCGMGHEDGELAWARAAGNENAIFMVPNLNSKGFGKIVGARTRPEQPLWFQIYVNPDRDVVLDQIRACEAANIEALCITVDSAVAGKRERDLRNKLARQIDNRRRKEAEDLASGKKATTGAGKSMAGAAATTINTGGAPGKKRKAGSYANRDPALNWDDVAWFKSKTSMKIVIKGVQTGLDAVKAAQMGCDAIILSNHGGRNLDTSRSGIEVLPEVMRDLREAGLEDRIDVFVDGGIRRGTDVLKCIALGAKAVGLGKPAVYAMSAYGQVGVERMLQILREELEKGMRLCGVTKLSELTPAHVNAIDLERHGGAWTPIPPSPYAFTAPAVGVRSPPFPKGAKSREELESEIASLQRQLSKASGKRGWSFGVAAVGDDSHAAYLPSLARVMLTSVLRSTFSRTTGGMLHRSALFMIVFLMVQAMLNLTVPLGAATNNKAARALTDNLLWRGVEWYLLLATVIHLCTAGYFTLNRRKYIAKAPVKNGKLAISGTVLSAFVGLHLKTGTLGAVLPAVAGFRVPGRDYAGISHGNGRDVYAAQEDLFKDPKQVIFYLVALASVGVHLWHGWRKAVLKMDITKAARVPFTALGHAMIWPLLGALAVAPCYLFALSHPAVRRYVEL